MNKILLNKSRVVYFLYIRIYIVFQRKFTNMHVESRLVWYWGICGQLVFSSRQRKIVRASTMNSIVKQDLISKIFQNISSESFLCKRCFANEIYCGVSNEQDMLMHIYHNHRGFWNVSIYLPSLLTHHAWIKLFDCDDQSNIKCRHCSVVFNNVRPTVLHNHIRTRHEILLLALSLANL